jgi:hypothetical protein
MVKILAFVGLPINLYKKSFISLLLLWQGLLKSDFYLMIKCKRYAKLRELIRSGLIRYND